jgi:hypothetical protein
MLASRHPKGHVLRCARTCMAAHRVGQEWVGPALSWIEIPKVSSVTKPCVSCVHKIFRRLESSRRIVEENASGSQGYTSSTKMRSYTA